MLIYNICDLNFVLLETHWTARKRNSASLLLICILRFMAADFVQSKPMENENPNEGTNQTFVALLRFANVDMMLMRTNVLCHWSVDAAVARPDIEPCLRILVLRFPVFDVHKWISYLSF